jgi:hypothetical protein
MVARCGRVILIAVLGLFGALGVVGTAHAQKTTVAPMSLLEKPEKAWWMGQLHQAREFGGRALAGLQAAPTDDSTPIDEDVLQDARNTYALIRSARGGIAIARGDRRQADPMIDLVYKRVDDAWNLARVPVDRVSWGNSRVEYLSAAVPSLEKSLHLLDQVFLLMP